MVFPPPVGCKNLEGFTRFRLAFFKRHANLPTWSKNRSRKFFKVLQKSRKVSNVRFSKKGMPPMRMLSMVGFGLKICMEILRLILLLSWREASVRGCHGCSACGVIGILLYCRCKGFWLLFLGCRSTMTGEVVLLLIRWCGIAGSLSNAARVGVRVNVDLASLPERPAFLHAPWVLVCGGMITGLHVTFWPSSVVVQVLLLFGLSSLACYWGFGPPCGFVLGVVGFCSNIGQGTRCSVRKLCGYMSERVAMTRSWSCILSNEMNACETTARLNPSKFASCATRLGLREGFAVDLTAARTNKTMWDFTQPSR